MPDDALDSDGLKVVFRVSRHDDPALFALLSEVDGRARAGRIRNLLRHGLFVLNHASLPISQASTGTTEVEAAPFAPAPGAALNPAESAPPIELDLESLLGQFAIPSEANA